MQKSFRKIWLPIVQALKPIVTAQAKTTFKNYDRLSVLITVLSVMMFLVVWRLFVLQVIDYRFYSALASDQHEIKRILDAQRGEIILTDYSEDGKEFPTAINKTFYRLYSVPNQINNPEDVAEILGEFVNMDQEKLLSVLSKEGDPYEPIEKKVSQDRYETIKALELPGIFGVEEVYRYYIDDNLGSNVVGFVGIREEKPTGLYGIEGYFDEILSGTEGFIQTERDVAGRWIALTDKKVTESIDGADILLTLDKTLQFVTCQKLNEAVLRHDAEGGSVIILEPATGKILAMCSNPDFNPNHYSSVDSAADYNNSSIFSAYEPGSVFKPIVMSAAMDLDYVQPDSKYVDPGSVTINEFTIRNANNEVFGEQTMANVLESSINTGMIHVARLMGQGPFNDYISRYGFGEITGIEIDTEVAGNISSLDKGGEIYMATASFGQGITTTPLQLVTAYGAIANGGLLMKPYIVQEIRHSDGRIEARQPSRIRQVISSRTSTLMTGMLASVVANGHAGNAAVEGYYVAGKTGTAQIASTVGRGYEENAYIHTFVGYAPTDDPRFAIVVRLDRPTSAPFAASTSARVFQDLAQYLFNYYDIAPDYNI